MGQASQILEQLMTVIEDRRDNPPARSYTTSLFEAGVAKIGEKITEEASEVVAAAKEPTSDDQRAHVVHEAADLIYHLFVLLGHQGISLAEVSSELAGRFGISGLDEKAARSAPKSS